MPSYFRLLPQELILHWVRFVGAYLYILTRMEPKGDWFGETFEQHIPYKIKASRYVFCIECAGQDQLVWLRWAHEIEHLPWGSDTYKAALENQGSDELLLYLDERGCPRPSDAISIAVGAGRTLFLQRLSRNEPQVLLTVHYALPQAYIVSWNPAALLKYLTLTGVAEAAEVWSRAAKHGRLADLCSAAQISPYCVDLDPQTWKAACQACNEGSLRWLQEYFAHTFATKVKPHTRYLAQQGQWSILRWLVTECHVSLGRDSIVYLSQAGQVELLSMVHQRTPLTLSDLLACLLAEHARKVLDWAFSLGLRWGVNSVQDKVEADVVHVIQHISPANIYEWKQIDSSESLRDFYLQNPRVTVVVFWRDHRHSPRYLVESGHVRGVEYLVLQNVPVEDWPLAWAAYSGNNLVLQAMLESAMEYNEKFLFIMAALGKDRESFYCVYDHASNRHGKIDWCAQVSTLLLHDSNWLPSFFRSLDLGCPHDLDTQKTFHERFDHTRSFEFPPLPFL